jgi:peptidyl-dipeptidase A
MDWIFYGSHFEKFDILLARECIYFFLGFEDLGDAWRQKDFFDTPELVEIVDSLWQELKPLYVQLHSYVRGKLKDYYAKFHPTYDFPNDGSIPAHLLGEEKYVVP